MTLRVYLNFTTLINTANQSKVYKFISSVKFKFSRLYRLIICALSENTRTDFFICNMRREDCFSLERTDFGKKIDKRDREFSLRAFFFRDHIIFGAEIKDLAEMRR